MKFTILTIFKCTVQGHLSVSTLLCNNLPLHLQNFVFIQAETLYPLNSDFPCSLLQSLITYNLLSVPMSYTISGA